MPTTRSRAKSLSSRDDAMDPNPLLPSSTRIASPSDGDDFPSSRDNADAANVLAPPRTDVFTSSRVEANSSFSNENVASIIAALQRSQTEAFKDLLSSVIRENSSTPSHLQQVPGEGTLTRCKASFSGRPHESVEAFIDAVEAFSECAQVTDSNILRGLSFLFTGQAATWWQGVKNTITSWPQAKENLISAYGDRKPPHRIYIEIFNSPQQEENTDVFVARIRALFSKIPKGDISEKAELDITYGLLNSQMRQRLRREDFENFTGLLKHARTIEDSFGEGERRPTSSSTGELRVGPTTADKIYRTALHAPMATSPRAPPARHMLPPPARHTLPPQPPPPTTPRVITSPAPYAPPPALRVPSAAAYAPMPAPPPAPLPPVVEATPARRQRPVCTYCRRFGHTRDQCRVAITASQTLSHVTLSVITNTVCRISFPLNLHSSNVCTSGRGGTSTCRGDSGGPLVVISNNRPIMIGITSFGSGTGCERGSPAAFARVTSFMSFFNQHIA